MRKIVVLFFAMIVFCNVNAQTIKRRSEIAPITLNTLFFIKDKLALEDADAYFLKLGYKFSGNRTYGDTVIYRYKKPTSYESLSFEIVINQKISAGFYTNSDAKSVLLMETVKKFGFKLIRNLGGDDKVYMEFQKDNLSIIEIKSYYPGESSASFSITLQQ